MQFNPCLRARLLASSPSLIWVVQHRRPSELLRALHSKMVGDPAFLWLGGMPRFSTPPCSQLRAGLLPWAHISHDLTCLLAYPTSDLSAAPHPPHEDLFHAPLFLAPHIDLNQRFKSYTINSRDPYGRSIQPSHPHFPRCSRVSHYCSLSSLKY